MSKLRSVSTGFWSDPFIEDLESDEKLLFLYLITNEKTNMLGIYEASIKKICFETGLNKETVLKALKGFERLGKVKYVNNYVVLVNYMKHQNYNTNMKKSAIDIYNNLPKDLKDNKLIIDKDNTLEGFERLLNHYGMVRKIEVEYEEEREEEYKDEYYYEKNNLKLTHEQYQKLCKDYPITTIDEYLGRVTNWKSKEKVKDLYLTMLNWMRRDNVTKLGEVKEQPKEEKKQQAQWTNDPRSGQFC
jgi:hypothetical protein